MNQNTKTLLGAVIAAALAIAVYYGVIDQKQAANIQNQANQTLGTGPAGQPVTPSAQAPGQVNGQVNGQVPAQAPASSPAGAPAVPAAATNGTAPAQH